MNIFKPFNKSFFISLFLIFVFCYPVGAQSSAARELNRRGVQAIDSGHHQEAVQLLREAMALEPNWGEPVYNAARLMRLRTQNDTAHTLFKKAYSLEPKNTRYLEEYTKGLVERLNVAKVQRNGAEMLALRREIVETNPARLDIGLELLNYYKSNREESKAYGLAKELIDKNPRLRTRYESEEMGRIYLFLAEHYFEKSNLSEAKLHGDNAIKYSLPPSANAKEIVAKIRGAQGKEIDKLVAKAEEAIAMQDRETAIEFLLEAEKIQPYNAKVQGLLNDVQLEKDINSIIAKAKRHASNEEWLEARDLLTSVVGQDYKNAEVKAIYDQAVQKENRILEVLGQINPLPRDKASRENMTKEFLDRGDAFFKVENYKDAKINYNKGLELAKFDKIRNLLAGLQNGLDKIDAIESRKNDWEKAIESRSVGDYEEVIKLLSPLERDYHLQLSSYLAEAHWKTGDFKKAMDYANYQLMKQPENNRARFVLGSIYLDQGKNELAYGYFKKIYDDDPDYPELSDKLLMAGSTKIKNVLPYIIIFILLWISYALYKYLPEYNKNTAIRKAKGFLKKDLHQECIDTLLKVRRLPILTAYDAAVISRILAQAFLKKGVYDKVIGECKHLLSLNAKDEEARLWLASAYLGRRMLTPESLPELLKLYKKEPRNLALVSLLGSHYTQHKSLSEEGVQILEQWLALEPNNPDVLKPLGKYYLRLTRTDDKAMKVFQKMMEIMTAHNEIEPDFLLGVARIHVKMRQFDESLHLCEQVINADVNNELVHTVLLDVYTLKNELDSLLEIYSNFLKNNPYNVAFQNGLMEAKKKIDNLEKAKQSRAAQQIRDSEMQARREQREAFVRQRQEEVQAQAEAQAQDQEQPQDDEAPMEQTEMAQPAQEEPMEQTEMVEQPAQPEPTVEEVQAEPQASSAPAAPVARVDEGIVCPNCQEQNHSSAYNCMQCGANLF